MIEAIIALDDKGNVGKGDGLPWPRNSEDMKWFKSITMGKVCVVGHNTAVTLPLLPGRVVVTMDRDLTPEILIDRYKSLIVIGGPKTYKQWQPFIDRYYIARIRGTYPADTELKEWAPWIQEY